MTRCKTQGDMFVSTLGMPLAFSALKLLLGLISRFLGSKDWSVNSFSVILNH